MQALNGSVYVAGRSFNSRVESVDVRLLVATNRELAVEVEKGNFRGDLFFRLNVFKLQAPPLRQRGQDVLLIAKHFLEELGAQYGRDILGFTTEAEQELQHHHWGGNVRELRNLLVHLRRVLSKALENSGISQRIGAGLMGVSEPTYRKWSRDRL
jgi:transcriptional regulator with GAF, ATPase, and Fis domain